MDLTNRRRFLGLAAATPLVALGVASAARAQTAACYSPDALPLSQKSRRRSLGYVETSGDPKKHCALCSFFTASQPACGSCTLLGGAVNAGAVCNSFSAKTPG
jgi:hypothetical protein